MVRDDDSLSVDQDCAKRYFFLLAIESCVFFLPSYTFLTLRRELLALINYNLQLLYPSPKPIMRFPFIRVQLYLYVLCTIQLSIASRKPVCLIL